MVYGRESHLKEYMSNVLDANFEVLNIKMACYANANLTECGLQ